jgi:hypothetical protein
MSSIKELERKTRQMRKEKGDLEDLFIGEELEYENGELMLEVAVEEREPRVSQENITRVIGEPAYSQLILAIKKECPKTKKRKFVVSPEKEEVFGG